MQDCIIHVHIDVQVPYILGAAAARTDTFDVCTDSVQPSGRNAWQGSPACYKNVITAIPFRIIKYSTKVTRIQEATA